MTDLKRYIVWEAEYESLYTNKVHVGLFITKGSSLDDLNEAIMDMMDLHGNLNPANFSLKTAKFLGVGHEKRESPWPT